MAVPLLDLKRQYEDFKEEVEKEIIEVSRSGYYIGGPKLLEFEKNAADYCGCEYGLGVSSGTDALLVSLMALDIKPGDEVITTTFSFFATVGVIARLGAKPVLCDIVEDTFNIDPAKIEEKITEKTKAMIIVHLYGQCAEMDSIMAIAGKYNIPIVEDAAQSIGAEYKGQRAGSFGALGCYSFFPSKNLGAFGDGGLVTTNDKALAEKVALLRNHGMNPKYYHKMIGGNFRMDAMQAAILNIKLKHLDKWSAGRQQNAAKYRELFTAADLAEKVVLPVEKENRHIYNQFTIMVEMREDLFKNLQEKKIGCDMYYPVSFHEQECFIDLGYSKGDFPVAEKVEKKCLSLPIFTELTNIEIAEVVEVIKEFYA